MSLFRVKNRISQVEIQNILGIYPPISDFGLKGKFRKIIAE